MIRLCYKTGRLGALGHRSVYSSAGPPLGPIERRWLETAGDNASNHGVLYLTVKRHGVRQITVNPHTGQRDSRDLRQPDQLILGPFEKTRLTDADQKAIQTTLEKIIQQDTDTLAEELLLAQSRGAIDSEILEMAENRINEWLAALPLAPRTAAKIDWDALEKAEKPPTPKPPVWRSNLFRATCVVVAIAAVCFFWPKKQQSKEQESGQEPAVTTSNSPPETRKNSNEITYFDACADDDLKQTFQSATDASIKKYVQNTLKQDTSPNSPQLPLPGERDLQASLAAKYNIPAARIPTTYREFCIQKRNLAEFGKAVTELDNMLDEISYPRTDNPFASNVKDLSGSFLKRNENSASLPKPEYNPFEVTILTDREKMGAFCDQNNYNTMTFSASAPIKADEALEYSKRIRKVQETIKPLLLCEGD